MKRKLLVTMFLVFAVGLTACGGSKDDSNAGTNTEINAGTNAGTEETGENETEESDMDLSIYPSSNIADFEASGLGLKTYDQLYAEIEPLVVESGTQDVSGTQYYKDANGNDLLLVFYEDGSVTGAFFYEYYENGEKKREIYTDGIGDTIGYQIMQKDINGQYILKANKASRKGKEFVSVTVYDYHANGKIAVKKSYEDNVVDEIVTYNENGDELSRLAYEDGVENYRVDSSYDAKGNLIKVEEYHTGGLVGWTTYEYDSNGFIVKENNFTASLSETTPYSYLVFETFDNGEVKKSLEYRLDENMFLNSGKVVSEDMYQPSREKEYYENGNLKKEIIYEVEYLENGFVSYKAVWEYAEDGMSGSVIHYDKEGNVIPE